MQRASNSPPAPRRASIDPRRLRLKMVREQIAARGISDQAVIDAMTLVPRHLFVPDAFASRAYSDTPLPIGYGQTISQPYTVGVMTQALEISPGMRVLEVGAGSGYQAAVLAQMGCVVHAIERLPELAENTRARLRQLGLKGIHLHIGDGTEGLPQFGPFHRILVSAGGPEVPEPLIKQLAKGGLMVIPVGDRPRRQRLLRLRKSGQELLREDLGKTEFVNLVGNHGW